MKPVSAERNDDDFASSSLEVWSGGEAIVATEVVGRQSVGLVAVVVLVVVIVEVAGTVGTQEGSHGPD